MLTKLRNRLSTRETGASELFVLLLTLPVILFMLFVIINAGTYFQIRGQVQQAAQQGARLVALYGGNTANLTPLNSTSGAQDVNKIVKAQLWDGQKCKFSACSAQPVVNCNPSVVNTLGQIVSCDVTYTYSPVAGNDPFGFSRAFAIPFKVSASYVSETRYNN